MQNTKTHSLHHSSNGKKVGLLGGSFNPPHAGHVYLAEQARNILNLDVVWLLPVPLSTLKQSKDVAEFGVRMALCEILAAPHDWLEIKAYEADIGTNETLDTVRFMQENFPEHDFTWIMGADTFAGVHKWDESADFINHMKTAVFGRTENENMAALASPSARNMQKLNQDSFKNATSGWCFWEIEPHLGRASDIRTLLKAGQKPPHVTERLWQELKTHRFYATP